MIKQVTLLLITLLTINAGYGQNQDFLSKKQTAHERSLKNLPETIKPDRAGQMNREDTKNADLQQVKGKNGDGKLQVDAPIEETLYGYRTYPSDGMGFVSFPSDNPVSVNQINTFREINYLENAYNMFDSGEFMKGDIYLTSYYNYLGSQYPQNLLRIATDTWEVVSTVPIAWSMSDMAYDYSTETMYGIISSSLTALFTINTKTAELNLVCTIDLDILAFAIDVDGIFYGVTLDGNLYTINKTTGAATWVGSTGLTPGNFFQSMAFDHNTGKLYWAFISSVSDGGLYEINKTTGAATFKGLIGTSSELIALHAPYYTNFNIPLSPSGFSVTPGADGTLSATLNWTNPEYAKSGNALTALDSIYIERNGVIIHKISDPGIGTPVVWTDSNVPERGDYTYTVYGVTNGDAGTPVKQTVFLGIDPCMISTFPQTFDFEDDSQMNCWTNLYSEESNKPMQSDDVAHSGTYSWRFSSYSLANDYDQYLISPRLASTSTNKALRFYYNTLQYESERFSVGYSTTDSLPSSFIWIDNFGYSPTYGWKEYFRILPPDTKFVAIYYHTVYRFYLYVDDITISQLPEKDAGTAAILEPLTAPNLTANERVKIRIQNTGMEALSEIPVKLEVDGEEKPVETIYGPFACMQDTIYTFNAKADLSELGKHTIKVSTILSGDENPDNDTKTTEVINYGDCIFSLPFTESFENAANLVCWTIQGAPSNHPDVSRARARTGEYSWHFASNAGSDDNDFNQYLITPRFSGQGAEKTFRFYYFISDNTIETFRIGYTASDAQPGSSEWEESILWKTPIEQGRTSQWMEYSAVFPENTKYVVIHYYTGYPANGIFIDDIILRELSAKDASVTAILSPISGNDLGEEIVKIKVKNEGAQAIFDIPVKFEVDGVLIGNDIIAGTIAPSAEITYTFTDKVNLSELKTYTIKAYTDMEDEDAYDNDTATVQVTNYGICKITVSSDNPYNYGFEESLFPCWSTFDLDADGFSVWRRVSNLSHSGEYSVQHSMNMGNQDGWMVTPKIAIPEEDEGIYALSFWSYNYEAYYYYYLGGKNSVSISTGSPDPESGDFNEVWSPVTVTESWEKSIINLHDYAGQEIYIAFRYQGRLSHEWYLDDLNIAELPPYDAGVSRILSPLEGGDIAAEVRVEITNHGATLLTSIRVAYSLNNQPAIEEDFNVNIPSGKTGIVVFNEKANVSAYGDYTLLAYTLLNNDSNPDNDNTSISFHYRKDITLYGYRIYEDENEDACNVVSFNSNTPSNVTTVSDYRDGDNYVFAGEYFDEHIYAYSITPASSPANFIILTSNWEEESKIPVTKVPIDMAYDYSTNTMYALFKSGVSELYTIDLSTGATTQIGNTGDNFSTLACDLNGTLYGVDSEGYFCSINKENAGVTRINSMGIQPYYYQSMAFDHNSGRLFWAMTNASESRLIEIDPLTGSATDLGVLGNNTEIVGLYTPYIANLDIIDTNVEDGDEEVDLIADIVITFNRAISGSDLSGIRLLEDEGEEEASINPYISGNKLVISHERLAEKTSYTLLVPGGTIDGYQEDIVISFTTGNGAKLQEWDNQTVIVYPNPTSGIVYLSSVKKHSVISILDLSGRVLEQRSVPVDGKITLDLHYEKGVYFIQIQNNGEKVIRKLIIK
ncbi:MAG: choice-of-anchor J domain-containing protein [Dysgonamonadaceae bacterium]|jgi:hypothetical protein|nr:choice-of-anchor J domain-containing protein [Dysgonamonadaceae bacterium]